MTAREFAYWLQGFFELRDHDPASSGALTAAQTDAVKRHLTMVFVHEIDPSAGLPAHQGKLNEIHLPPALRPRPIDDLVARC